MSDKTKAIDPEDPRHDQAMVEQALEILQHQLTLKELSTLAWRLFDRVGITVFVAHDLDGVRGTLEDTDMEHATDEQIREAMEEASEGDWSDVASSTRDAIESRLEEILKRDRAAGPA
jgi:hypothetical protein